MRFWMFLALVHLLPATSLWAQSYTWVGRPPLNSWSTASNWSPNGVPDSAGEEAVFASGSLNDCNLSTSVTPTTVTLAAGFAQTLRISAPSATLSVTDMNVTSGTLAVTGRDQCRVAGRLLVEGGTIADVSVAGEAVLNGGTLTLLRLNGANVRLRSDSPKVPATVVSLQAASGNTTQTQALIPVQFDVAEGATYTLGSRGGLSPVSHRIEGHLALSPLSAMLFATGTHISTGSVSMAPGSAIVCQGDWSMTGTFTPSGDPTTALTIVQLSGGTIDHGTNAADLVLVKGAAGVTSTWTSTNQVLSLSVPTSTTLALGVGAKLTVTNSLLNLGRIDTTLGGQLLHTAAVRFTTPGGLDLESCAAGDTIRVSVNDLDNNLLGTVAESLAGATVTNARNGDSVALALTETQVTTGIFEAALATANGSAAIADSTLQVLPGDTISLVYTDPDDAADNLAADAATVEGGATPTASPTPRDETFVVY